MKNLEQKLIEKAKAVIRQELKASSLKTVTITIEEDGNNVDYFVEARKQMISELNNRQIKFKIIYPIEQAKKHLLNYLNQAKNQNEKMVIFPVLKRDFKIYIKASNLPEVQNLAKSEGIDFEIQVIDQDKDILIQSIENNKIDPNNW